MLESFQVIGVAETAHQFEKVRATFVLCDMKTLLFFFTYSDCSF